MNKDITMGMNRTGLKASPVVSQEMLETLERQDTAPAPRIDADALRLAYTEAAEPVGSVPPPTSVKGLFGATVEAMQGHRLHIFLDKLGERAAFERSGVRLYDAMLRRLDGMQGSKEIPDGLSVEALREIRDEEAAHFALVSDAIERLGGDSTTQTPCADVTGVQGMGLMQVMNDPRTTPSQALHTLLAAELIDGASWDLLIELAEGFDQDELVSQFRHARARELEHEQRLRTWLAASLSTRALGH